MSDQQWLDALARYGYKSDKPFVNPEQTLEEVFTEVRNRDWRWREEIEKYLPQLSIMSFCGPTSTIRWLFEHVHLKQEPLALAGHLQAIEEAKDMTDEMKTQARLETIFPNLGDKLWVVVYLASLPEEKRKEILHWFCRSCGTPLRDGMDWSGQNYCYICSPDPKE